MNFFKKLLGIQTPKQSDSTLSQAEWKQLEEYGEKLVDVELKKDEPSIAETPSETIKDEKNVFKKPARKKTPRKKTSRKNVFKNPSKYSDSAVYTIEGFHWYIEWEASALLNIFSQDEIDVMYRDWSSKSSRSFNDFIWSLFNQALLKNEIVDEYLGGWYWRQRVLYLNMGRFRFKESESVKACNQWMRLGFEAEINAYKHGHPYYSKYVQEAVLVPHPRCEYAKSLDERYSLDEVLDKCGVALDGCNCNTGCGCSFAIVPKKDADGRLMRKD